MRVVNCPLSSVVNRSYRIHFQTNKPLSVGQHAKCDDQCEIFHQTGNSWSHGLQLIFWIYPFLPCWKNLKFPPKIQNGLNNSSNE